MGTRTRLTGISGSGAMRAASLSRMGPLPPRHASEERRAPRLVARPEERVGLGQGARSMLVEPVGHNRVSERRTAEVRRAERGDVER